MIRRIVFALALVGLPLGIWFAAEYGRLEETTFERAAVTAQSSTEGEQAPKALLRVRIEALADADGMMTAADAAGRSFRLQYSGSTPVPPFEIGAEVRFVGHVHGGTNGYFHATQVYQ
jgi:hypothetical protein